MAMKVKKRWMDKGEAGGREGGKKGGIVRSEERWRRPQGDVWKDGGRAEGKADEG